MLSLDDCELEALMAAAAALPIESRERFLVELAQAVSLVGATDIGRMIDRSLKSHQAAADFCPAGDNNVRFQGL
jgi:hypothetical protein